MAEGGGKGLWLGVEWIRRFHSEKRNLQTTITCTVRHEESFLSSRFSLLKIGKMWSYVETNKRVKRRGGVGRGEDGTHQISSVE